MVLRLIGVSKITENSSSKVNVNKAYKMFPHVPAGALERPTEAVSVLIGQDYAALLPTGGDGHERLGHLRVMRVELGSGLG